MDKVEVIDMEGVLTRDTLPALSEHTFLRYFSFVILYLAQGVPQGITYFGVPAWMAMNGKSPAEIGGYAAALSLPWSFKILVAPLMDRFTFLAMGRRRPWVLVGQFGLILSFLTMGLVPDPLNQVFLLSVAGFFVSFFAAFQDVATDSMAIDIVPEEQQARANGLMWGSKTVGISISLVVGNWIINHHGFFTAMVCSAFAVSLMTAVPFLMRERPGEKLLPWTRGKASPLASNLQLDSWSKIIKGLTKVVVLPSSLLLVFAILFFNIAMGLMEVVLPVFTIQGAGWTDADFSQVFSACKFVAGLLGMIIGGMLADVFSKKRMMTVYMLCMILLMSVMAFSKAWWSAPFVIAGFIGIYYILYVFTTIAIFATGMELCWKRVAASQFCLYMTISNLGRATGAAFLGPLRAFLPWEYVFLAIAGFCMVMAVLIQWMRQLNHQGRVEALEAYHLQVEK